MSPVLKTRLLLCSVLALASAEVKTVLTRSKLSLRDGKRTLILLPTEVRPTSEALTRRVGNFEVRSLRDCLLLILLRGLLLYLNRYCLEKIVFDLDLLGMNAVKNKRLRKLRHVFSVSFGWRCHIAVPGFAWIRVVGRLFGFREQTNLKRLLVITEFVLCGPSVEWL